MIWAGMCCTAIQSSQRQLGQLCCPLTRVRPRGWWRNRQRPAALPLCRGRVDWGDRPRTGRPCPGLERNPCRTWVIRIGETEGTLGCAGEVGLPASGGPPRAVAFGSAMVLGSVARPFRRGAGGRRHPDEPTCPLEAGQAGRHGPMTLQAKANITAPQLGGDLLPQERGLFDPKREYDACGVGFIADLRGGASHDIIKNALYILENLEHRGAVGADPIAGDGAGILIQVPHAFLQEEAARLGIKLPKAGHYAVGHIFMPQDARLRDHCEKVWMRIIREQGLQFLGWRSVPVANAGLSEMVKATEPVHRQLFVGRSKEMKDQQEFERRLYLIRKVVSNAIYYAYKGRDIGHYSVSLSSRTLVYKGMFLSYQVKGYYADLSDPRLASAMALVHQRFSTNTFPSWKLAHPYRMV